jgi:hypothetical protein
MEPQNDINPLIISSGKVIALFQLFLLMAALTALTLWIGSADYNSMNWFWRFAGWVVFWILVPRFNYVKTKYEEARRFEMELAQLGMDGINKTKTLQENDDKEIR